ncbi:MAG: lysophospholipid acyltransferase family protein [Ferruginibacter sp.]
MEKPTSSPYTDPPAWQKRILYRLIGLMTYPGLQLFNRLYITGMDKLSSLPKQNVLFVCNHQTYFADVISLLHIFCAAQWGHKRGLGFPLYLLWPKTSVVYVAAAATMQKTWIARLFTLAGAITVKRVWNETSGERLQGLDMGPTRAIAKALEKNWVITFPQGTTTPYAPGRKGTCVTIKTSRPTVVPIVLDGFSTAFDKTGLKLRRWGTPLRVTIKDPLVLDLNDSHENMLMHIMDAIEQSPRFQTKLS